MPKVGFLVMSHGIITDLISRAAPPPKPTRPLANPNLFKPTPQTPSSTDRKVSFQDGPNDEIGDMYSASPDPTKQRAPSSGGKASKWQPLSAVEPSPIADNDPFSLGDSDDDKDRERDAKTKESKADNDHERVREATAEAMAGEIGEPKKTGEGSKAA